MDPSDEHDERFPLPKHYVSNLDKRSDRYEGEVNECGNAYGRGIRITEFDDLITITEGFFINNIVLNGLRRGINFVKDGGICQMITGTFENGLPIGICSTILGNDATC